MYKMRATKTHTGRHNKHTHTKRIKIINYFNSGITVTRRRGLGRGQERGEDRGEGQLERSVYYAHNKRGGGRSGDIN